MPFRNVDHLFQTFFFQEIFQTRPSLKCAGRTDPETRERLKVKKKRNEKGKITDV